MSEYFSKEDISRVLLERIGANESCLSNARKLGNHEGEQYFHNLVFEDEQITSLIEELTTYSFPDREKGEWKKIWRDDCECSEYVCSKCDCGEDYVTDFCPNCGADMRGKADTETWNGIHAQITAPKGTFDKLFEEAKESDEDDDFEI